MGKIDYNFFKRIDVTSSDFSEAWDMLIPFTTTGVMFLNEGTGVVEFSFNGTTVHGRLDSDNPSKGVTYDNRVVTTIWFKRVSGDASITVRVEGW